MGKFHIEPERECPGCDGTGSRALRAIRDRHVIDAAIVECAACNGTGTLPADGEPEIETDSFTMDGTPIGWFWREVGTDQWCGNPNSPSTMTTFTTEAECLAAARKALKGE